MRSLGIAEYDFEGNVLINDVNQGSGRGDLRYLVPLDEISIPADCSYGSSACSTYFVLYAGWGDADGGDYSTDAGFNEWKVKRYPILTVTKDVFGSFETPVTWNITKESNATYNMFAGESTTHTYDITLGPEYGEAENTVVYGTITIVGDEDDDVYASVEDSFDGLAATITSCSVPKEADGTYFIAAESTVTCNYMLGLDVPVAGTNVARASYDADGSTLVFVGSADLASEAYSQVFTGDPEVNVTDDYASPELADDKAFGPFAHDDTLLSATYDRDFACSSDLADYAIGGTYSYSELNTATIDETGASDIAIVTVNCYIPSISKLADGAYDERHEWTVLKTVDPGSQSGFAGDEVGFDWTITVTEEVTEEFFDVTGTITVGNPNPEDVLVVSLVDWINGHQATIDQTSCAFDGTDLTVGAGGSETCDYEAMSLPYDDVDLAPDLNTATIVMNDITFSADDPIEWTPNVIRGSATLDDDQYPYSGEPVYNGWTDTYPDTYTCSTDLGDYTGGSDLDNEVVNLAEVFSGGVLEDSSEATTVIDCYIPSISKLADGAYDERHEWTVLKTVDPGSQSGFAGDEVGFDWTITVTEEVTEEFFDVTGTITVGNPNPEDVLVVSLVDWINGHQATIDQTSCAFDGTDLTVGAGGSETCDYEAMSLPYDDVDLAPDLNTATIVMNDITFSADDPIEWTPNVIRGSATLDDDQYPYSGEPVYNGWTDTYPDTYTCSTDLGDYTGGSDLDNEVVNLAEVFSGGVLEDSSEATTVIDCYIPSISKLADGAYDERHEWTVLKTVDPGSQSGFAGDEVGFDWTITVTEEVTEEFFDVTGTITVGNPNPEDVLVVSLVDWINGHQATIDQTSCAFDGTDLTVGAGGSETCDYEAMSLPYDDVDLAPDLNTATIVMNDITFSADDPIEWTPNVIRGSATLDDDQYPYSGEPVYNGWTDTYPDTYTCSTDLGDYTGGSDLDNEVVNLAEVFSGGVLEDSSEATTVIDCYIPSISKLADGAYDERHEWTVLKTVDPGSQSGFAGDEVGFDWTITVTEEVTEEFFDVTGTITVGNPNPEDVLVVSLVDWINGHQATIDQTSCAFDGTDLTVAAGGSETCDYEAMSLPYDDVDLAPDLNTATIVMNDITFSADDPIEWTPNVIRGSATLDDDQYPYSGEPVYNGWTDTYPDTYTCSTDLGDYTGGSDLDNEVVNLAEVFSGGVLEDSSEATTVIDCYIPSVTKDANTEWYREYTWEITKDYDGHYELLAGESVDHGYLVSVTQDVDEYGYRAYGNIQIVNPAPIAMTATLTDVLSNSVSPTITGCSVGTLVGSTLTVPAGSTATCSYAADLADETDLVNTATLTLNGIGFTGTADVVFGAPSVVGYPSVNVDDTNGMSWFTSASNAWPYTKAFTCPTEESFYTDGVFTITHPNTATIRETGQWDDALVTVECTFPWEGLTPGYWKNHLEDWVEYTPGDLVSSVFDTTGYEDLGSATLLEALSWPAGNEVEEKAQVLLHHATAAVLNAAHPNISYPLSEAWIIEQVNLALASGDPNVMLALKDQLDMYNNYGADIHS